MRGALSAAFVAAMAAAAFSEDQFRTFTFEVADDDKSVRLEVEGHLAQWMSTALEEGKDDWKAQDLGALDVVRGLTTVSYAVVGPGTFRVDMALRDAGLPSASATAWAAANRIAQRLESHVRTVVDERRAEVRKPIEERVENAETNKARTAAKLADFFSRNGDPALDREVASERLRRVEAQWAEIKIERAVTSRKLDAARHGANLALEVKRLEQQVLDAEDAARSAAAADQEKAVALVKETRRLLLEATSKSPTFDAARELVASLEIEAIALEAREASLRSEREELRPRLSGLRNLEREEVSMVRMLEAWERAAETARTKLDEIAWSTASPAWRLVSPVASRR